TELDVIAAGGVSSVDDLRALSRLERGGRELAGVIVGKALYEGRLSVEEAVAACAQSGGSPASTWTGAAWWRGCDCMTSTTPGARAWRGPPPPAAAPAGGRSTPTAGAPPRPSTRCRGRSCASGWVRARSC